MKYRMAPTMGIEVSALGLGCMRLPRSKSASMEVMQAALDAGINYFDTAYIYGNSEERVGEFLARSHRDRVLLATKLPHYLCGSAADFDRIFDEELSRLQTDYIDFYLIHMLSTPDQWERLCKLGIEDWIARRKATGQIRHIGFSYHGSAEDFKTIVDAYGWEFTQIQLNYFDAHAQAGMDGLRYAAGKGLPVIIMEPLRGGSLVDGLPAGAQAAFARVGGEMNAAQWGLQWVLNLPEVTCVLSGMNTVQQIVDNAAVASLVEPEMLSDEALGVYDEAVAAIKGAGAIACTGCRYCMPCPQGVDIPTCFHAYNAGQSQSWIRGMAGYFQSTSMGADTTNAGKCIKCGACERRCPQQLPIRDLLDRVSKRYEGIPYKAAVSLKRRVMHQS